MYSITILLLVSISLAGQWRGSGNSRKSRCGQSNLVIVVGAFLRYRAAL
jgi:hypothetical protein